MLFNVFVTILFSTMTNQLNPALQCGPYGFYCLNLNEFQLCPLVDSDGNTETPTYPISCKKGYICDEENPAYCTPFDTDAGITLLNDDAHAAEYYDDDDTVNLSVDEPAIERTARKLDDPANCGCLTTTTSPTTTEIAEFPTTILTTPESAPFQCEEYGFFPDPENKNMFWYCDVNWNGVGYHLRHMLCGKDRVYNDLRHACILQDWLGEDEKEANYFPARQSRSEFSCAGKHDGLYPNTDNCHKYHICGSKKSLPLESMILTCPKNTAFDPSTSRCSRLALHRCVKGKNEPIKNIDKGHKTSINCKSPSRFRETRDCGGYFLCYGDQLLEMRCPGDYRFDDSFLECLPQQMAKCEESN